MEKKLSFVMGSMLLFLLAASPGVLAAAFSQSSTPKDTAGDGPKLKFLDSKKAKWTDLTLKRGKIEKLEVYGWIKANSSAPEIPTVPPPGSCYDWSWLYDIDLNPASGFPINDIGADNAVRLIGDGGLCGEPFPDGVYSLWLFDLITGGLTRLPDSDFEIIFDEGIVRAEVSRELSMLESGQTFFWVSVTTSMDPVEHDLAPDEGHVTHVLDA